MGNWTEANVENRDSYDAENGRGRGNVKVMHSVIFKLIIYVCTDLFVTFSVFFYLLQIVDNITEQYRADNTKKASNIGKQKTILAKKSDVPTRSKKKSSGPTMEIFIESTMKRMMEEIKTELLLIPDRCAKVNNTFVLSLQHQIVEC